MNGRKYVMSFIVVTLAATAAEAAFRRAPAAPSPEAVSRVTTANGAYTVRTTSADAARNRLEELKRERPAEFERAAAELESRGYKPTDVVVVHQVKRNGARKGSGSVHLAQSYTDGDTEVMFWSWDDGDHSTWEGQVYIENHTSGAAVLLDGQIQINVETLPVTWESQIYYRGPRTAPAEDDPYVSLPVQESPVQIASAGGAGIAVAAMRNASADYLLVQSIPRRLQDWAECAAAGCWSGMLACRWSGPGWMHCSFGACLAVMLGCAMSALF